MGGGVVFRVWAPNATTVSVPGEFNSWNTTANPMALDSENYWSVYIPQAQNGQEYKYHLDGNNWRKDPRSRVVVQSGGFGNNSIIYDTNAFDWGDDSFDMPPFNKLVIYEIHLGTFETNGGFAPGKFDNAITRLDYLADLGVNLIHLMPINEFAGDISAGYNPSDPFSVENFAYGGPDGLKRFNREARRRGIGVILDVVHNHWGPADLDLYNFDGGSFGGIYFYEDEPDKRDAIFGDRPNFSTQEVRDYITENILMWEQEYRFSGIRWDFTKVLRARVERGTFNIIEPIPEGESLLREIMDIYDENTEFINIAEDFGFDSRITQQPPFIGGAFGFDSEWDGAYHPAISGVFTTSNDADRNMGALANQMTAGDYKRMHYIESHDEVWSSNGGSRLAGRMEFNNIPDTKARRLGIMAGAAVMGTRGIPMFFMGQEIFDLGVFNNNNPTAWNDTAPIDWTRLNDPNISGFRDAWKRMIKLRTNALGSTEGLSGDGAFAYLVLDNPKFLAVQRDVMGSNAPGDDVVILMNFSSQAFDAGNEFEVGLPNPGIWYEQFNSDSTSYGTDFTNVGVGQVVQADGSGMHGFSQSGGVQIGPFSVVILSQAELVSDSFNGLLAR
jgi:1,4-alpha-glucan branching enzyme